MGSMRLAIRRSVDLDAVHFPFAFCLFGSYFAPMKRHLVFSLLGLLFWAIPTVDAAEDPRAYAQRQQDAEQQRRINARLVALEEALQAYQKEVNSLRAEVRGLREELSRTPDSGADVSALAEKIREVDRKRLEDQKLMLDALAKLQKQAAVAPRAPATPVAREEYEYEIRSGDSLYAIIKGLEAEGFKVKQEDVMKANPGVKWNRLQVGQKIIIPSPKR